MSVTGTNISLTLRNVKGSELTYTELDNNQSNLKAGVENHSHDEFAASLGADDNYVTDAEKAALHSHTNKTSLDKINESAGAPTWNGGAWPSSAGGGDMYKSVYDTDNDGVVDAAEAAPWTGLTGTVSKIPFNTGLTAQTLSAGEIAWNPDERTFDMGVSGVTLQAGQEQLINVRNGTASTITNGTVCMATGTIGASGRITVAPMDGTNAANAIYLVGIATEDITAGADGFVTTFGKVRGVNTAAYIDGDVLYTSTSTAGALTKVVPTAGLKQPIAFVVHAHSNGVLFVRIETLNHLAFAPALGSNDNYVTDNEKAAISGVENITGTIIGADPTVAQAITALDNALTVTTYEPTGLSTSGTNTWSLLSGTVADLVDFGGNGVLYQEGTGSNQIVEINWDNVNDWNKLHVHYRYYSVIATSAHTVNFEIYNRATTLWESVMAPIMNDSATLELITWNTDHGADYVTLDANKRVRTRFIHTSNGSTNHRLELEHCILQHGLATGDTITTHAGLSGRSLADQHPASSITNTPAGNIAATTIQAAINELDSEKAPIANGVTNGDSHDHSGGDGAQIAYSSLSGLPSIPSIAGLLDETAHDALDHTGLTGIPAAYSLPTASTTVLGGVKVDGTSITINSGVISSSATGGGMTAENKTASFNAANNYRYIVSTSGGAVTATLPASPAVGDYIEFVDAGSTWTTTDLVLARNGLKINGATADFTCDADNVQVSLTYTGATYGWAVKIGASVLTAAAHATGSHSDWPATVSMTEVGYLDGVTSAIQTQFTGKADSSHTHGNITSSGYIGSTANLPIVTGTSGIVQAGSWQATPSTQAYGDAAAAGTSNSPARGDHKHAMPATTKDTTAVTGILKGNGTAVSAATSGTDYALPSQTFYIGTTQVAINRASAALTLAGITLTTPTLGVATATSINKLTLTAPATSATLTIADGKTLTCSNTVTLTGTDSTSYNLNALTSIPQNTQSAGYTLVIGDAGKSIVESTASSTLTIPANSSVAFSVGTTVTFVNNSSGNISIAITTDTMYLAGTATTGTRTLAQRGVATAYKVSSTVWFISGMGLT